MNFYHQDCEGLLISSLALGTYLGDPDDETDARQRDVILAAIRAGVTYIDTAANYRCGRAEKAVGAAIAQVADTFRLQAPIVVGTKAGFLPYRDSYPAVADRDYFQSVYIDTGIVQPDWIVGDWQCFHPAYLEWQFNESLHRLGRSHVDIFYLHNPEAMVPFLDQVAFRETMAQAFSWCMQKVRSGQIRFFGISTWSGLLGLSAEESLSLIEIHALAASTGAQDHFKFIQAPFSAGLTQALTHRTQADSQGRPISLLRLTAELGMHFFGSAPLLHGKILSVACPDALKRSFPWPSDTQVYLDFARSCPGLRTTIVGTTRLSHLQDATALLNRATNPTALAEILSK